MRKKTREELLASLPEDPVNSERPTESLQQKADRIEAEASGVPVDDGPGPDFEQLLADQLSREYDYRGIAELEKEDPERAQEHRDAAHTLLPWIHECPREERRAAFGRGFDKGKERQKARTAADMRRLEAEVAEIRKDRDPEGLRTRIRELEYALGGWDRLMTGRTRAGAAPDWRAQAAEYLAKLTDAQRELAVLKGVQPYDTRESVEAQPERATGGTDGQPS